MTNPYAPPQAAVRDVVDPYASVQLADRGARLGAAILDTFIFGCMVYLPFFIGAGISGALDGDSSGAGALAVGFVVGCLGLIVWAYFTIIGVNRNGQSIAKKMVNIKVVRVDGSPVSLGRVFWLRNVVNTLLSFIPLYGIIDSLFIFAESRQCVHDKISDTIVVKA